MRDHWILTAAHCFVYTEFTRVDIGGVDSQVQMPCRQILDPNSWHLHPQFNSVNLDNDIALLRLTWDCPIDTNAVLSKNIGDLVGAYFLTAGFGETETGSFGRLYRTQMQVIKNKFCSYPGETISYTVDEKIICTRTAMEQPSGACYGDSGGPLYRFVGSGNDREIVGVVSSFHSTEGLKCDSIDTNRFVRVGRYYEWLESVMGRY